MYHIIVYLHFIIFLRGTNKLTNVDSHPIVLDSNDEMINDILSQTKANKTLIRVLSKVISIVEHACLYIFQTSNPRDILPEAKQGSR